MKATETLVQLLLSTEAVETGIWSQTLKVACHLPAIPKASDYGGNKASFNKAFNKAFTSVLPSTEVPVTGTNRTGSTINLHKKSGEVKWSTWSGSARMMQNLSDIGTALFYGIEVTESSTRRALREEIKEHKDSTTVKPEVKPEVKLSTVEQLRKSTASSIFCNILYERNAFSEVEELYRKLLTKRGAEKDAL